MWGCLHGFLPAMCVCTSERNNIMITNNTQFGNMATKECLHTCGPCSLCTKSSEKYKHYQDLTLEEKGVIFQYKRTHSDLSCICYPCMKQIARFIQNPNLKACPRWVQKQPNKAGVCNIASCHEQIHSNTRLATPSEIEQLLAVKMEAFHSVGVNLYISGSV